MKLHILLFIFFGLSFLNANSQQKFSLRSQNFVGILDGEAGTSVQFHSINGLQYKKWFGGIGAGLDHYYLRSIPLFLSFSREFSIKHNIFYFSADGGVNFPWVKNTNSPFINPDNFKTAGYWGGGFGYRIPVLKYSLLIHIGYSYKHMKEKSENTFPCIYPPCPTYKEQYDYYLKRVSVKAGWMF
jgi:hypothetical protein